jgi:hypothetical protein
MTTDNVNKIMIENKEYIEADLTEKQRYIVAQVRDLQARKAKINFEADQVNVAIEAFSNMLIEDVKQEQEGSSAA